MLYDTGNDIVSRSLKLLLLKDVSERLLYQISQGLSTNGLDTVGTDLLQPAARSLTALTGYFLSTYSKIVISICVTGSLLVICVRGENKFLLQNILNKLHRSVCAYFWCDQHDCHELKLNATYLLLCTTSVTLNNYSYFV